MERPAPLTTAEIEAALRRLPGWTYHAGALRKTYAFETFAAAFGWMAEVALAAERLDHHPDWRNVYNRVEVTLSTHDVKALTALDLRLAEAMDAAAHRTLRKP